jgi:hypothetical protein
MLSGSLPTETVETPTRGVDEADDEDLDALRRELRRRERERDALVRRYERLLAERDERIAELRAARPDRTLRGCLRARLRSLLKTRR